MALKNPSDFFDEEKKESIIDKLVERPELKSFSDAFNVYKENISKIEDLSETLKSIESIQSDIKDFIKKEDLDNAVVSYAFLLEETVSKLKNDVTGINEKHLIKIRSNVSGLAEKINNFVEVEAPKYKKSILESEIKSSDRYEKFKNDTDIVIEDITKYITNNEEKTEENISSLNETLDKVVGDLEEKINLISDNKDTIFQDLSKKITEVKNLKKSINKDLKVYEDHKNNVENKISDLEVEIIRSKSNLKENLEKQNEEFVKVQKNVKTNFNSIRKEFKTVVDKLNLDNLEEKNNELSKKVRYLEEVFAKFNEKEFLSEGLLNIPPETKNSDPLTPLDKDFVTLDQLQDHYRLFLNRIQQQLATFGGGGETQLKYLDDVVGIATNPAAYDGGYLRYVHSLKKFAFSSPSDGDTWIQGVDGPYTMGRVGIGTSLIQSGDYPGNALVVDGNARFTGIVSIGTSSITLDASTGSIAAGDVEVVSAGGGAKFVGVITAGGANFTGDVSIGGTLTYEDVKNVDSIGIITAGKDVRVGRNFNVTGLSTFTGITTFSNDIYVGGDLNVVGDIVYDEVSGRNLNVTGVSTLSHLIVSGISSFTSTSHTKLPSGTTAQRPVSAVVGDIRYNTQTNQFEGYKGSSPSWGEIGGGGGSPGGSNTQIQFNDSNSFEGDANLTFDGSKLAVGVDLDVDGHTELDDVNVSGVATIGNVTVGGATTDLIVEGNARVTGILSVGTGTVVIDETTVKTGTSNLHSVGIEIAGINVQGADTPIGTGATIYNSGAAIFTGIVTATTFKGSLDGTTLSVSGISTLGVVTSGTWQGTAITNSYISSATTWNAKQDALTFGLSSGNALKSEEALSTNDILLAGTSQIKGRTYAELKSDLSLNNVENTALSTWTGSTKITSVGIIGIGTWQGTAITNSYISSATTWNAKQDALTFGIADTNAVKIDSSDVADDEYARFTANGLEGRTATELKSDLSLAKGDVGLGNVENTALSTWAGTSNITTVGTLGSLSVTGDVSIGGTLTYEDVTNIDSVGIITAQKDVRVGRNFNVTGISTFSNTVHIPEDTIVKFGGDGFASKLNISYAYGFNAITIGSTLYLSDSTSNNRVILHDSGNLEFKDTSGTTKLEVNDHGINVTGVSTFTNDSTFLSKVGIGITNPTGLLHIQSNNPTFRISDSNQAADNKTWNISGGNSQVLRIQALNDSNNGGSQYFDFYRDGNTVQEFRGVKSGTPWFVISNDDKKVGIGTTNPLADLQVGTGVNIHGNSGIVSATTFSGNATSATTATLSLFSFMTNNNTTNETVYPVFVDGTTSSEALETDSGFMYNPSTGILTATGFSGSGADLTSLPGGELTGIVTAARLASNGTADSSTFLRGDGSWAAAGGGFTQDSQGNLYAGTDAGAASDADTCFNIGIGQSAGKALNEGDGNVLLGCYAGSSLTSGSQNVAIGNRAGASWATAGSSVAIGFEAAFTGGSGDIGNVFIGCRAGYESYNANSVAIGKCAQYAANYGSGSISIGAYAGRDNQSGENTFVGCGAGMCNKRQFLTFLGSQAGACAMCAGSSTFVGTYSGQGKGATSTGCYNTFVGNRTGRCFTSAASNTFLGQCAGCIITTGSYNTFLGNSVGEDTATGSCNVAIGHSVSLPILNGDHQLAIGSGSNYWITGNSNWNVGIGTTNPDLAVGVGNTAKLSVGIVSAYQLYGDGSNLTGISAGGFSQDDQANLVAGNGAGAAIDADTCFNILIGCNTGAALNAGDFNIFMGCNSGATATTANHNIGLGLEALKCSEDTTYSVAIGTRAGKELTSGAYNVFLGGYSGLGAGSGGCNVALGKHTGKQVGGGSNNVFLGHNAGCCSYGQDNILIGSGAASNMTGGNWNTVIGKNAASSMTLLGGQNVFLGMEAGCTQTTTCWSVAIGQGARLPITDGCRQLSIGCYSKSWIVGDCCFNVGMGTTIPNAAVGVGNTAKLSVGILSAYQLYGDGSNLTNLPGGGGCLKLLETNNLVSDGTCAGCALNSDSDNNIILGCCAGVVKTGSGDDNVVIGHFAGKSSQSGHCQILIGMDAGGGANNIGNYGIMIGKSAGYDNTSGQQNIFLGADAGYKNDGGSNNIYLGSGAGCNVSATVNFNIAIGCKAAFCMTGGNRNVIIGCRVNAPILDGDNQLAIGIAQAYNSPVTDYWITGDTSMNVGIGTTVPTAAVSVGNTAVLAVGIVSAYQLYGDGSNLSGLSGFAPDSQYNLAAGTDAGKCFLNNSDSEYNVAIGWKAGCRIGALSFNDDKNVAIGYAAGRDACNADNSIFIGAYAGCGGDGTASENNVFIGRAAGASNSSGKENVFLGNGAGQSKTTGDCNIAIGKCANQCGSNANMIAIGSGAGRGQGSDGTCVSQCNVFLGPYAGYCITTGGCNVTMGVGAGCKMTTGDDNIALGRLALSGAAVTGNCNIAIGVNAGNMVDSGHSNVFIGKCAAQGATNAPSNVVLGQGAVSGATFTGDENVVAGFFAGCLLAGGNYNVLLGSVAGRNVAGGSKNFLGGYAAGDNITSGSYNVIIGSGVDAASATGDKQFIIGCGTSNWICGDSSFNVTLAGIATATASGGIFEATKFCGDGSCLTGLAGWSPNAQDNLIAGNGAGAAVDADTCLNIFIGCNSGAAANEGDKNVFIGGYTGCSVTSGSNNVAIGDCSLSCNVSGDYNVALGVQAGKKYAGANGCNIYIGLRAGCGGSGTVDGVNNIMIGMNSGMAIDGGDNNIFMGCYAAKTVSSGSGNIMLGDEAGCALTTGTDNIGLGHKSMGTGTVTGNCNIALGTQAGTKISSGQYNVFFGKYAGWGNTSGHCNIAIGCNAGKGITEATENISIGGLGLQQAAGNMNVQIGRYGQYYMCGACNISLGQNTMQGTSTAADNVGHSNIALGKSAMYYEKTGCYNIAIGQNALYGPAAGVTGNYNIALGYNAAKAVTSGTKNSSIGYDSGLSLTSGGYNALFGNCAGRGLTTGNYNTSIGDSSLYTADNTGSGQVALGYKALCEATNASYTVAIGGQAGKEVTTSEESVFIGYYSAGAGAANITGNKHVIIGNRAGLAIQGASACNTFLGNYAGCNVTTGSKNVIIGNKALASSATGDTQLAIGNEGSYWITGDSSFNIFDKDGNQLNGASGGGADVGVSSNTNYIGTGVTNFNFVGTGITASLSAGASANTVANVYIPSATRTTNRYIATADQTTFSATYTVGYVDVFLNGIKLDGQDEFTATNGTSVVLTDGATVGDIVEIVAQQISANLTITGITDVVNDTTPQLGGNLDVNGKDITGTGDVNLTGIVTATTFSGTTFSGTNINGGTFSGSVDLSGLLKEGVNITAGKLSDNLNIDLANGMVHLFTTTEDATALVNLQFGGSSVNAKMSTGEAITVVIIVTAAAAGYAAHLQIDGSGVIEEWLGGSAPSEGGAGGYDVYTHNIIKTADATFVVLSNLVNFA